MKMVFFGDSICFGEKVSPHKTWIARLSAAFEKQFGHDLLVINSSVNGNTTRLALERIPSDVQKYEADVLLIQFGMNDCNFWETDKGLPRVSPSAFQANLHEIADRGLNFGAKSLFIQTNHPTLRTTPFAYVDKSYEESNKYYNELVREVAVSRSDIQLIDIERAWSTALEQSRELSDFLLDDELHLSVEGHNLYFQTALPHLSSQITNLLDNI